MRRFLRFFRAIPHYRRASACILLCSLMTTTLNLAFPLVYLVIFKRLIPTQDPDLVAKTILVTSITAAFVVLFYFLMDQFTIGLRVAITRRLREDLVARMLDFPYAHFRKRAIGDIVQRLIPEVDTLGATMARTCTCAGNVLEILLIVALMAAFNRPVLIAYALFAAGNLAWTLFLKRFIQARKQGLASSSGRVYERFFQVLAGVKQIKAMNLQERQIAAIGRELAATRLESAGAAMLDSALMAGPAVLFKACFLVGLVLSFIGLKAGDVSPAVFVWTLILLYKMGRPFEELAAWSAMLGAGIASARRVGAYQGSAAESSGPAAFQGLETGIEFRSVTFGYDPGRPVLREIDLTIPRGADLAVVGESGSGKSSLIGLLLRLHAPQQGSIRIDRRDIAEYDLRSLRQRIGVVSQDIFLFNDTIRRNVDPEGRLSDAAVLEVCSMCSLDGLLGKTGQGLATRVGERGALLSGGEKQRVAIARLMAKGADVIIFDEATSALDPLVEKSIRDMVLACRGARPGLTTITVSHRPGAIAGAESVCVLKEGRIVESGLHGELISRPSHFHRLFPHAPLPAASRAA